MVPLRRITIPGNLDHVEAELRFQMFRLSLRKSYRLPKLRLQLRILERHCHVDGGVAGNVRRIMRQGAHSKSVLVRILALEQQLADEVSTANVMDQIAE